jgi:hypothetical protein
MSAQFHEHSLPLKPHAVLGKNDEELPTTLSYLCTNLLQVLSTQKVRRAKYGDP